MKAILGGLAVLAIGATAGVCPDHVRQQAGETIQVSEVTRAEFARQMDLFVEAMRPDPPDFSDTAPARP